MDLGIKGKCALVTGGSHGIGFAIARALADEGCHVAICARNQEPLSKAVCELKARGVKALGVSADVLVPSDIVQTTKAVTEAWGTVHILVNNVGGGGRWGSTVVEETDEEVWIDVYNKNVMAAIRFTRWAIPLMRKQKWGRVVTVSGISGREAGYRPWYSVAKSAEVTLMKSLAVSRDLAGDGITFNSVAPGAIMISDTGWHAEMKRSPDTFETLIDNKFPLGRMGTPEEVANVVVFMCSEKASLLNGACIVVDGGESKVI